MSRSQLGAPGAVWEWPLVPDNNSAAAFPWVPSCLGKVALDMTVLRPGTEVRLLVGCWCLHIQMQMLPGLQRSRGRRADSAWGRIHPLIPLIPSQSSAVPGDEGGD